MNGIIRLLLMAAVLAAEVAISLRMAKRATLRDTATLWRFIAFVLLGSWLVIFIGEVGKGRFSWWTLIVVISAVSASLAAAARAERDEKQRRRDR